MSFYEAMYLCCEFFLSPLYRKVRRRLLDIVKSYPYRPDILDVGGRKSHYTIGVAANITISDLPRISNIQKSLNLGINQQIIQQICSRRTNVRRILYDDMTHSSLASCCFDCALAVEVLEHVEDDILFVQEVHRVLKPEGFFLMTTPNGEFIQKYGEKTEGKKTDHKRLYTKSQLYLLLRPFFPYVQVEYAIKRSAWRSLGLRRWSLLPWITIMSMVGNFVNSFESTSNSRKDTAQGAAHLIVVARKG